jgi:outer membrane receptor protein involved in Fe transport
LAPVVVDVSPLGGGIRLSTWPQAVRVLGKADLARHGKADAVGALEDQVAGVNVVNSQANPYQPTILFHGFEMSPIQGTPAGLSVYVNGARFNAPFGDLAIWSVLPPEAMQSVSLEDGNPVFGLNALGGALSVKMKDGFSAPGGEAEVSGGSFGQIAGNLEYGGRVGDEAAYVDVGASHEAGWRDAQSSDVQSFYADLGWRGAAAELHVNATLAHSALAGPGTVPVQVLAAQPGAQFTGPNSISDKYFKLAATLNDRVRDDFSVQSVVYDTNLREQLVNGNGPNDLPCGPGPDAAYLCANGQVSMARGGAPIPDFLPSANADGYYSYAQLNLNTTNTNGYGASVQATYTPPLQHVVAGASFDGGFTGYDAAGYIGGITQGSRVYYTPAGIPSPGYELDEPGTVPVGVLIRNEYEGLFVSDTVTVTPALSITAGGRWNVTEIALHNQDAPDPNAPGGGLNGGHFYEHANPAVGAAYQFAPALTLYGGYSVENAAPTPAELSCASPADSCSLANFMSGDPALKQIVSRNFEAGLRGAVAALRYDADVFDNIAQDDIEFLQSPYNPIGSGYFSNVGNVHRRGVDASVHVDEARWQVYASYSYTEATYGSSFVEQSNNPGADANGNIFVQKGDYLPGVPRQTVKFGGNFWVTPAWQLGVTAHGQSAVFLYGDEANLTAPLPGFLVFDLTTKYQLTKAVQLFVDADNVTDRHYYNYGTFSPVGGVYVAAAPNFNNPRSYSVAAPIAVVTGLKLDF